MGNCPSRECVWETLRREMSIGEKTVGELFRYSSLLPFLYIIVTYAVLVSSGKSVFEMSLLKIFVLYAPIVLAAVLKSFGGFPSEHPFLLGFNEFINVSKSAGLTFGSPNTSVCL